MVGGKLPLAAALDHHGHKVEHVLNRGENIPPLTQTATGLDQF